MRASARQTWWRACAFLAPGLHGRGWGALAALSLGAGAATLGAGCAVATHKAAIPEVRLLAERDLDCAPDQIRIEVEWGGRFEAIGCGRKAQYDARCDGGRCSVTEATGPRPGWRDRPDPQ